MRHLLITTALALTPYAAIAETQAERFETLTEDMTQVMWGMMATEAENAGGDGTAIRAAIGKSIRPHGSDDRRNGRHVDHPIQRRH